MPVDPNEVKQEHLDALAELLQSSPALQAAVGVTANGNGRLNYKGPKKPHGTFGVSRLYQPQEYPKHVYRSRTEFETANSVEEEEAFLAAGYRSRPDEFEPEPAPIDEVAELRTQVELMTKRLASASDRELRRKSAE